MKAKRECYFLKFDFQSKVESNIGHEIYELFKKQDRRIIRKENVLEFYNFMNAMVDKINKRFKKEYDITLRFLNDDDNMDIRTRVIQKDNPQINLSGENEFRIGLYLIFGILDDRKPKLPF